MDAKKEIKKQSRVVLATAIMWFLNFCAGLILGNSYFIFIGVFSTAVYAYGYYDILKKLKSLD